MTVRLIRRIERLEEATIRLSGAGDNWYMTWAGSFFPDLAILSTKGFIPSEGTFESSVANFRVKKVVSAQAKKVVLMVDHLKFGQRALCKVLDASRIDAVITDAGASEASLEELRAAGMEVHVAQFTMVGGGTSSAP